MRKKNHKTVGYVVAGFLALLILFALIVPSFVDANKYKGVIEEQARSATGRALTIEGDIRLTILPAPALSVSKIKFANAEGASSPDMVQLSALRVRVALLPLFMGRVEVDSLSLVDPVIELERLPDGKGNWEFTPAVEKEAAASEEKTNAKPVAAGPAVQIDRFTIENGTLVYRDAKAGTRERLERINANIRAESLVGPFRVKGNLLARGMPVAFTFGTGRFVEGPGTPINLEVTLTEAASALKFSGTLSAPNPTGVLTGTLAIKSKNVATLIGGLGDGEEKAPPPRFLTQELSYESSIIGSSTGVELREIALGFGKTTATGSAKVNLGEIADVEANLQIPKIDFDDWLAMLSENTKKEKEKGGTKGPAAASGGPAEVQANFALPQDLSVTLNLAADSIVFQGGEIRQSRVNASLAGGELMLNQATAQLPGETNFSLFGFLSAVEGKPRFEGDLDFRSDNLRSLLSWLRVDIANVPTNRARKASLAAKLVASPEKATAKSVDFKLDESRLTGTVAADFAARPSLRAEVAVTGLNLDSYLLPPAPPSSKPAASKPSAPAGKAVKNDAAALDALDSFDVDLSLTLDRLVFRKQPISGVRLVGTLASGALTVREASVQDLVGTRLQASGTASALTKTPKFDAQFDLRSNDIGRLFLLTGGEPLAQLGKLGETTVKAQLHGGLDRFDLDAKLDAAKGSVRAKGEIGGLPDSPAFNLRIVAEHPDLAALLETLGGYKPKSKLGELSLQTQLKGTSAAFDLVNLAGRVGPVTLNGNAGAKLDGSRPAITAKFEASEIPVHRFLPAEAASQPAAAKGPGKGQGKAASPAGGERWSKEPLDLSALRLADAEIGLTATALLYDNLRIDRPELRIVLKDGVLELHKLSGNLFDGAFNLVARVADGNPASAGGTLAVRNANIRKALFASSGLDLGEGNLNFDLDLKTAGKSTYEFVSGLNGVANVVVQNGVVRGFDLDAVSARLNNLNNVDAFLGLLDTALSGGETRFQDLRGKVRIANGIAKMEDVRMQAQSGAALLTGKVDLPAWNMDMKADFRLAAHPDAPVFAMLLDGPPDNPRRRFDTKQFQSYLVQKGIGSLLKKVLPLKRQEAPADQPPAGTEGGKESPPPPKPEKVIQDIFKGLGL